MAPRAQRTLRFALAVALVALGLAAVAALASVTVYNNNFSRKSEAKEIRHASGNHCDKRWRSKAESFRVVANKGPGACVYRPPVEADGPGPDHKFQVRAKLLKDTPKGIRDGAFVAVAVRAATGVGYELRVFPSTRKFQLRRSPGGGGGDFPAKGHSGKINGGGKSNILRIDAIGDTVTARVNGTKLAKATDSNAAQVSGRKVQFELGQKKSTSQPTIAVFDDVRLALPSP
jgi:hypothetical protein